MAIETKSLKELFALRQQLWADPHAVSAEIAASLSRPRAGATLMHGETVLMSGAAMMDHRIAALESRLAALETPN